MGGKEKATSGFRIGLLYQKLPNVPANLSSALVKEIALPALVEKQILSVHFCASVTASNSTCVRNVMVEVVTSI